MWWVSLEGVALGEMVLGDTVLREVVLWRWGLRGVVLWRCFLNIFIITGGTLGNVTWAGTILDAIVCGGVTTIVSITPSTPTTEFNTRVSFEATVASRSNGVVPLYANTRLQGRINRHRALAYTPHKLYWPMVDLAWGTG